MIQQQQQQGDNQNNEHLPSTPQTQSKATTHLTIPSQNQNPKIKPKLPTHTKASPPNPNDKKFKKLSKQSRKVKSLQDEYRELEEEVREIKELVQLQMELIDYSTQEICEKFSGDFGGKLQALKPLRVAFYHSTKLQKTLSTQEESSTLLSIKQLQTCLGQLFSYHQTIETANSNYLLLSQVNKQQESQSTFHIHNLQERIRQLRFLLNGKQDLLAYETATFQSSETPSQDQQSVRKIFIDYHLPKKESMNNTANMEGEFRFVEKVVREMARLREEVEGLEQEVGKVDEVISRNNRRGQEVENAEERNGDQQGEKQGDQCEDHAIDNVIEECCYGDQAGQGSRANKKAKRNDQRYMTPSKTTRTGTSTASRTATNPSNIFTECQNTLHSAVTSRFSPTKPPVPAALSHPLPLTLLPLSTHNYKHSLIYRVGKLHEQQITRQQELKVKFDGLRKEWEREVGEKRRLVEEYEVKRDVYGYKKRVNGEREVQEGNGVEMLGMRMTQGGRTDVSGKIFNQELHETNNILDALEEDQELEKDNVSNSHQQSIGQPHSEKIDKNDQVQNLPQQQQAIKSTSEATAQFQSGSQVEQVKQEEEEQVVERSPQQPKNVKEQIQPSQQPLQVSPEHQQQSQHKIPSHKSQFSIMQVNQSIQSSSPSLTSSQRPPSTSPLPTTVFHQITNTRSPAPISPFLKLKNTPNKKHHQEPFADSPKESKLPRLHKASSDFIHKTNKNKENSEDDKRNNIMGMIHDANL